MIPKVIHYCWFGGAPKPELFDKCLKSWKRKCPGYSIVEWNENNYDITQAPLYVRQAYEAKQWAFVSDYVRLDIIYSHGGIYLDTDVELKKNLDFLLGYNAFFGYEDGINVNTGLGFGAVSHLPVIKEIMSEYESIPFRLEDGSFDRTPCPERNSKILRKYGLKSDNSRQVMEGNILILPKIYMCPINYLYGTRTWSLKTISVHRFSESWKTDEEKKLMEWVVDRNRKNKIIDLAVGILGEKGYLRLRKILGFDRK